MRAISNSGNTCQPSFACRSLESAIKLAERFMAGLSRHNQATADVTKPRPAAAQPSTPAPEAPAPVAVAAI